MEYDYTL